MTVVKQLYQLQEIDLELESNERAQQRIAGQLGESQEIARLRAMLAVEQQRLDDLSRDQQSAEWQVDDLTVKITAHEDKLYGGTIKNPKELASLQHEVDELKVRRAQSEDRALEIMDQVELARASVAAMTADLSKKESEWQGQQEKLAAELEQLKSAHSDLAQNRESLSAGIEPQAVEVYTELRRQKGTAVARVEQGMCRGCQIALPTTELQKARAGSLVRCSSCGRILFLA
jgi:predicted  nucleic acid-binding Zn-ribbon protein